jgi:hypothetical protein
MAPDEAVIAQLGGTDFTDQGPHYYRTTGL